jgi:hypothetical protein
MRLKADEIVEKIRGITVRFSAIDVQVTFNVLKSSLQNLADYFVSIVEHRYVTELIQRVDEALLAAFSHVIGANISDGNHHEKVKDFTELRFSLKAKNGGGGYRKLAERYSFINCMNNVIPRISSLYPHLRPFTGDFENDDLRWETFFNSGIMMGGELKEAIEDLHQRKNDTIYRIGKPINEDKINVISEDVVKFGKDNTTRLSNKLCEQFEFLKVKELESKLEELPPGEPRREAYLACKSDPFSKSLFTAPSSCEVHSTSSEFREEATSFLSLHSPLMRQYGIQIIPLSGRNDITTDDFGHNLKATTGVRGGDRTTLHNDIHRVIGNSIFEAGIPMKGKLPETCANTFSHLINTQGNNTREREEERDRMKQGIIPDIIVLANPAFPGTDPVNTIYDGKNTICDIKTLGPGLAYKNRTATSNSPTESRQSQVNTEYHKSAKDIDRKFNGTAQSQQGPVHEELLKYGHQGKVAGLVFGNYGEGSAHLRQLATFVAKHEALKQSHYSNALEEERAKVRARCEKKIINGPSTYGD